MTDGPVEKQNLPDEVGKKPDLKSLSRRTALARLGLGAAIAYSAPVIVHLDRSAHAAKLPTPCPRGSRKPACRSSVSSKSSKSSGSSNKKKKKRRRR